MGLAASQGLQNVNPAIGQMSLFGQQNPSTHLFNPASSSQNMLMGRQENNAIVGTDPTGNGIARGIGVTQAQVDAANKGNPYQRSAADVEEQMYGGDRANVLSYAGSIANNQSVPQNVLDSINRLKKAGVYSPVNLSGYG